MRIQFSVTPFIKPNVRVGVVGSIPELGEWKVTNCFPLAPYYVNEDEKVASMWSACITINTENLKKIEYKFVFWETSHNLLPTDESILFPMENEIAVPEPVINPELLKPPTDLNSVTWEGSNNTDNRCLFFEEAPENFRDSCHKLVHYISKSSVNSTYIYYLPVYHLLQAGGWNLSQIVDTNSSCLHIKKNNSIHYNRILNRVLVGTTPRSVEHIEMLKKKENISDVFNFQTNEDIADNFTLNPDPKRCAVELAELYDRQNLRYIHYALEDLSSVARARGSAQAVLLLSALLLRKDCTGVYVHCNAGVGRSIACVVSYIHIILGAPMQYVNFLINVRRPLAYFDQPALIKTVSDFNFKFSGFLEFYKKDKNNEKENVKAESKKVSEKTSVQKPDARKLACSLA